MTATTAPDPAKLRALLDGEHAPTRDRVREWLSAPGNAPVADLPIEEHRARVLAWATELASGAVVAMGLAKRAIDRGLDGSLDAGLREETAAFAEVFDSEDATTGIASFKALGPGKATFKGR